MTKQEQIEALHNQIVELQNKLAELSTSKPIVPRKILYADFLIDIDFRVDLLDHTIEVEFWIHETTFAGYLFHEIKLTRHTDGKKFTDLVVCDGEELSYDEQLKKFMSQLNTLESRAMVVESDIEPKAE